MVVDFSADSLQQLMEDEMEKACKEVLRLSGCKNMYEVNETNLNKQSNTKKDLANGLNKASEALDWCKSMLESALVKFDQLKNEHISLQSEMIEQQKELLKRKTEQIESFQATVKTELRSYSDSVLRAAPVTAVGAITANQVKDAVKSVVAEDDRGKNLMVFGLGEELTEGGQTVETRISEMFQEVDEKPRVVECSRIGYRKSGVTRAIKVTLRSTDTVQRILSRAGQLRRTTDFRTVYLAADRTSEEREARKQLVEKLKQKRETDPNQYHYIKNNEICSRARSLGQKADGP